MFDVHCHMLPGIDDGSKSIPMSLDMIDESVKQGVNGIIFTPHFYADMNSPESFLVNRSRAMANLEKELSALSVIPEIRLGAEVHYYRGMSRTEGLDRLCVGNSNYILIEMPFRNWQPQFIDEVEEISSVLGLHVILAHVERYFNQDKRLLKRLLDNPDLLIQCNAEFFIDRRTQGKALRFFKSGRVDLLASDSHNLDSRRPNIKQAVEIIGKKDKKGYLDHIWSTSKRIFDEA